MPYKKTKDGSLVNEVTLGDGYPLSNDLQPLKVGGEASPIEMSTSLPDGSDNAKVKVRGDLEVTGGLNFKNDVEVDLSFDDLSLSGDLDVAGSVGIGTTSPTEMLHLQGTGDVKILLEADTDNTTETDNPEILFSQDGGAVTGSIGFTNVNDLRITNAYNHDDGDIHLQTRSTTRMSVLGNGNVGIGTASPDVALEINGGAGTDLDPLLRINKDVDGDGSATGILIGAVAAGQSKAGIFFENKGIGSGRGSLHFCSDNTSDTSDATIADARMTIIDGGNVGIGTDSPTTKLHVEGSFKATGVTDFDNRVDINQTSFPQLRFSDDGGTDILNMGQSGEAFYFKTSDTANNIRFRRSDNEDLLELDMSELRVGINTTSPTTTLDVDGTVSYKHTAFSTAGPTDSIDVSDTTVLEVDTSSNNVTIGGFSGGVQGQVLYIVKTDTTNFIQLEHDETPAAGSHQKIFLTSGADERVVGYGGYTLYCNGTNWYSLSNPTGAADAG